MYYTPKCKHAGLAWAALVVVVALVAIAVSTLALKPRYQTAVKMRLERLRLSTSDALRHLRPATTKQVSFRAELPAVEAAAAGFTASDAGNIALTPSRAAGEDAGTYVTSVSYASKDPKTKLSNYAVTVVPGVFTIKPVPVVLRGSTASKAYGVEKDLPLKGTLGPLPEEAYKALGFSSPPVVLPQDRRRVTLTGARKNSGYNGEGKYDTVPAFVADDTFNKNYKVSDPAGGTFTITPRCGPPEWGYSIDTMGKCWKCPGAYSRTAEALTLADKTTANPKACASGTDYKAPYIFSYPA